MVVSTGIDIVEVYRIRDAVARTPRFAERVFTDAERIYCESKGKAAEQSLAGRYAAKEAFFKALKTGWRGKVSWHDVEVVNDDLGAPQLKISGEARSLLDSMGVTHIHVSISHTAEHAVAHVLLESD